MAALGRGALALTVGIALALPHPTWPDTLWLDNGDRISGRILSRDESVVRIDTSFGLLSIPRSRVVRFVGAGTTAAQRTVASALDERVVLDLTVVGEAFWQARERIRLRSQDDSLRFELRLDGALLAAYEDHTLDAGEIRGASVNVFSFKAREARAISGRGVKLLPVVSSPSQVTLQLTLPPSTGGSHRLTASYLGNMNAYGNRDVLSFATLTLTLHEGVPHHLSLSQHRGSMEFAGWPRRRMKGTETFTLSLAERAATTTD